MGHDVAANGLDTWTRKHGATFQVGSYHLHTCTRGKQSGKDVVKDTPAFILLVKTDL